MHASGGRPPLPEPPLCLGCSGRLPTPRNPRPATPSRDRDLVGTPGAAHTFGSTRDVRRSRVDRLTLVYCDVSMIKFGTDGWRGIVGDDFTFAAVRRCAQGMAEYLLDRHTGPIAVVGYDCRFGSEVFGEEVARVLAGNGVRTLLFDRPSPTQVASWTVIERGASGAVVVTASHNPYLFNGLKYKPETGSSAPPEVIAELERRINALGEESARRSAPGDPLIERCDPRPAYCAQIRRMVDVDAIRSAGLR